MEIADRGEKLPGQGSQRVCIPEASLARILPMKHHFGISRLANVTGLDRIGLPVALAIRPNARSIAVSQGKGRTLAHAKASALMEAIEIWHGEHFTGPLVCGRAREPAIAASLIDLARLPAVIHDRFSPDERYLWVPADELMGGGEVLVPFEMVHADYTHPLLPGDGNFPAGTNGLASGNHLLEAICHGLCEVVERDALAVWHAAPLAARCRRRLDPASVTDDAAQAALAAFARGGLECGVWDITSDIGVAGFMCVIRETDPRAGHLGLGSGCHPDRATALMRALTEAAQTRLNYTSGAREDLSMREYTVAGLAEKHAAQAGIFASAACPVAFGDVPDRAGADLRTDLDGMLAGLAAAGIAQVAVVDLTRPEFAIPVVRVIVPGLEAPHEDSRYVPGPRAREAAGENGA